MGEGDMLSVGSVWGSARVIAAVSNCVTCWNVFLGTVLSRDPYLKPLWVPVEKDWSKVLSLFFKTTGSSWNLYCHRPYNPSTTPCQCCHPQGSQAPPIHTSTRSFFLLRALPSTQSLRPVCSVKYQWGFHDKPLLYKVCSL